MQYKDMYGNILNVGDTVICACDASKLTEGRFMGYTRGTSDGYIELYNKGVSYFRKPENLINKTALEKLAPSYFI